MSDVQITPMGRNDSHVFDYSHINEHIFIGSDFCKGGVCLLHKDEFEKLGVSVEINVSAENNEMPPKEIETYLWLPVVDGYAPNEMQFLFGNGRLFIACNNQMGKKSITFICKKRVPREKSPCPFGSSR